jgi:hypothetical protein
MLEANQEQVGRQQVQFLEGQTTTLLTIDWSPDWEGELDLIVHVDSDQQIEERNENNSFVFKVNVASAPEGGLATMEIVAGIIGILVLLSILGLFVIRPRLPGADDEAEEWVEYDDEEGAYDD